MGLGTTEKGFRTTESKNSRSVCSVEWVWPRGFARSSVSSTVCGSRNTRRRNPRTVISRSAFAPMKKP